MHGTQDDVKIMVYKKNRKTEQKEKHRKASDAGTHFVMIRLLRKLRTCVRERKFLLIRLQENMTF